MSQAPMPGPLGSSDPSLEQKLEGLKARLCAIGPAAVAFSAGVDSTLLLAVAAEVLEGRLLAITIRAPMVPAEETRAAEEFCRERLIPLNVVDFDPFTLEDFVANPPDRCYHCKRELMGLVVATAHKNGYRLVLDGTNADDLSDYRPGLKALDELGVRSPLAEAGLSKNEVRALSRTLGLATADKPAYACLATRIATGHPINTEILHRVETAEKYLHDHGFLAVRVRCDGDNARIEAPVDAIAALTSEPFRSVIAKRLRELGFHHVSVDLEGYRPSGDPSQATRS